MKKILLLLSSILYAILLSAQINDTIKIDEIVIRDNSISKYEEFNTDKEIESVKSTGELIQQMPGVTITKRSSFSIEPSINSFKYDQINTTINGGMSASSSCPNRMDPIATRISPDEINKIEVVRGPYEVRYGQIMGGFVNLISNEKPSYTKLNYGGNVASEYNNNGNGKISSLNIRGGNKVFDLNLNLNYRKFDNYFSGEDSVVSSAYEAFGANVGFGLNISKKQRVFLNYMYAEANDVMHAGLPMDAKYDISNMVSLDYEFNDISKIVSSFKVKLFAANEDHLMTNEYRPNASISLANTPVFSNDLGGRFVFELKPVENGIIYLGADFKYIAKDGNKEITQYKNPCTTPITVYETPKEKIFEVWQNSYSQDAGAFINLNYYFSSKLIVKGGLRTNFNKSNIKEPEQDFIVLYNNNIKPDDILNFNYYAQTKYYLTKSIDIELSAGHGTRNPSLLEQYINHFTVGLDAYEYVGNPHLKSESNNQVNLMISKNNKVFSTYIDVFYSQIDNYITAVVDTTILRKFLPCKEPVFAKRFVNIDKAQQYGINFGAKYLFSNYFSANIDLSYVYAENLDFNDPLPEVAPFTSIISGVYKNKNLRVNLSSEYQATQTRISNLVNEQESEEFIIFNISASYLLFNKLNIGIAIDNILDTTYYRHLSRPYKNMDSTSMFYEPGRNLRLFVKCRF